MICLNLIRSNGFLGCTLSAFVVHLVGFSLYYLALWSNPRLVSSPLPSSRTPSCFSRTVLKCCTFPPSSQTPPPASSCLVSIGHGLEQCRAPQRAEAPLPPRCPPSWSELWARGRWRPFFRGASLAPCSRVPRHPLLRPGPLAAVGNACSPEAQLPQWALAGPRERLVLCTALAPQSEDFQGQRCSRPGLQIVFLLTSRIQSREPG